MARLLRDEKAERALLVLRGGSWNLHFPTPLKLAFRFVGSPDTCDDHNGFRVVLVVGAPRHEVTE